MSPTLLQVPAALPLWGWLVPAGVGGAALLWLLRMPGRRSRSVRRLRGDEESAGEWKLETSALRDELPRRRVWAALPGLLMAVAVVVFAGVGALLAASLGAVVAAVGLQLEALWHERRCERLESALASSVDLVVAALQSGTSIQEALKTAARRSRQPLAGWLDELLERLRLGEAPPRLFAELAERVPLEGYRLFGIALATSWESGGRYAEALARAGRAIRDRLALRRRVRSQSIETRFSMFGVLALTWVLFALAYSSDPERMADFARAELGSFLLASALLLQAVGILWIDRLTREEL
jgi:Flp pilus assembly protein TadB